MRRRVRSEHARNMAEAAVPAEVRFLVFMACLRYIRLSIYIGWSQGSQIPIYSRRG